MQIFFAPLRLCVFALKKGEMLTVAGLSKAFGGRQLFDDVSLTLLSGERATAVKLETF